MADFLYDSFGYSPGGTPLSYHVGETGADWTRIPWGAETAYIGNSDVGADGTEYSSYYYSSGEIPDTTSFEFEAGFVVTGASDLRIDIGAYDPATKTWSSLLGIGAEELNHYLKLRNDANEQFSWYPDGGVFSTGVEYVVKAKVSGGAFELYLDGGYLGALAGSSVASGAKHIAVAFMQISAIGSLMTRLRLNHVRGAPLEAVPPVPGMFWTNFRGQREVA